MPFFVGDIKGDFMEKFPFDLDFEWVEFELAEMREFGFPSQRESLAVGYEVESAGAYSGKARLVAAGAGDVYARHKGLKK